MPKTDKMAAEIEAMEKQIYSNPDEKAAVEEEVEKETTIEEKPVETEDQPADKQEEVIVDKPVETVEKKPEDKEDWKKRFVNYKSSSDATIHGLRQQNVALGDHVEALEKKIQELSKQISSVEKQPIDYKELFSEEERDMLGEDTLQALAKISDAATKKEVEPLKKELEEEREKRREQEKTARNVERETNSRRFLQKLGEKVPDYEKLDVDPAFHRWMEGVDPDSGFPKKTIFHNAHANGDVGRVAQFFLDYKEETKPVDKLAGKVTPTSTASKIEKKEKKETKDLTVQDINKFYDDVTKGRYRGRLKEMQEMEKRIDDQLRRLSHQR